MGTGSKDDRNVNPFHIWDCAPVSIATGRKAYTLRELVDGLKDVPAGCIYHHFWGRFLQTSFDEPEYNNEFSSWVSRYIHDKVLAERLGVLTPIDFPSVEELRQELVEVIEERLEESETIHYRTADQSFNFIGSQLLIMATGRLIQRPQDLADAVRTMSAGSLFYHFIDARRRTEGGIDDFTAWLHGLSPANRAACSKLAAIDPYFTTLGDLRHQIAQVFSTAYPKSPGKAGTRPEKSAAAAPDPAQPTILDCYAAHAGAEVVGHLKQLSAHIKGLRVLHVNSTREGGGVAEILNKMVPLMQFLGIEASWEIIQGESGFYRFTKGMHNALQGTAVQFSEEDFRTYERANAAFAEEHRSILEESDVVIIHDPQPAAALGLCPKRRGKWVWRCHIDISRPNRHAWGYLRKHVQGYDASIFSMQRFAQRLPHTQYLIPPSIDPLSEKNMDLPDEKVAGVVKRFDLDPDLPMLLQVSRFDRFKDPVGVIEAYRLVKRHTPVQLVLAGGSATDDPEGAEVLEEVRKAAQGDPDIHILLLPPDAHVTINALQRAADIVLQKSVKEGFGLTVAEAMWKKKPVIGGNVGGILLQITDHVNGYLVSTPEGAALRIRYLLHHRDRLAEMGARAQRFVAENFLLTRHLRDYLALITSLVTGRQDEKYLEVDLG